MPDGHAGWSANPNTVMLIDIAMSGFAPNLSTMRDGIEAAMLLIAYTRKLRSPAV